MPLSLFSHKLAANALVGEALGAREFRNSGFALNLKMIRYFPKVPSKLLETPVQPRGKTVIGGGKH